MTGPGKGSASLDALMGLADITRVVVLSVLKLVIAGGASALAYRSLRKSNSIEARTLRELSNVNKQLFVPMFIFCRCSEGITGDTLVHFA